MKYLASLVLSALILSACSTFSGPPTPFTRSSASYDAKQSQIRSIAVIADVCLIRDEAGSDDYWLINGSRSAARHMLEGTATYLTKSGYKVDFAEAPFVCAHKYGTGRMKYAADPGAQVAEMEPPLFEVEGLARDPAYRQSLITLINATQGAIQQVERSPSQVCCKTPPLKRDLDTVSKVTGGDAILFLAGDGVVVPEEKSLAQGVATGAATAVLTLGFGSYAQWNVSYMDNYAALVDVETGDILWGSSSRTKGGGLTEKGYYSERWAPEALSHLPSRTDPQSR
jgi:hypothetical protein